jgi:hypothetical protein
MLGAEYSADIRARIHNLSCMSFSGKEISHLLAIPPSSVSRILHKDPELRPGEQCGIGRHRKLSRSDVEVSCGCLDLNICAHWEL